MHRSNPVYMYGSPAAPPAGAAKSTGPGGREVQQRSTKSSTKNMRFAFSRGRYCILFSIIIIQVSRRSKDPYVAEAVTLTLTADRRPSTLRTADGAALQTGNFRTVDSNFSGLCHMRRSLCIGRGWTLKRSHTDTRTASIRESPLRSALISPRRVLR